MANISSELIAIDQAARGEEVRDSIIDALVKLNTEGVDNCETLQGRPASYFASANELNTLKQNLVPDGSVVEIYPQDWDDDTYSFEWLFPSNVYDIFIQPGPNTTVEQLNAIGAAGIVPGSVSLNIIRCVGTVPTINIQVMVLATIKT